MSKVLITGAAGFTGHHLVKRLAQAGYDIYGTAHVGDATTVPKITQLHRLDIADPAAINRLVREIAPDKVVHLAAISFVAHSDAAEMYRTNVLGTRNLLEALSSGDTTPSSVIIASSANIYGNSREGLLDESVPPAPANDYAVTKAAVELVASLYANRLPLTIVRPFNYTGRGQSDQFLVPKIVSHARRREPEIELGNLDIARDFSDVRAVVDVYARLLNTPAAIGGIFNVCSGRAITLRQIIEAIERLSGHHLIVRTNPAFVRSNEVKTLWGSPDMLEQVIGPLAMPSFGETLRWMLEE